MSDEDEVVGIGCNDGPKCWEPEFDIGIDLSRSTPGKASYWVFAWRSDTQQTAVEVSREVWQDAAQLLAIAEARQARRERHEQFDSEIDGTIAQSLRMVAEKLLGGEP